eukprot:3935842-Rhodomonas_salina.1
MSGPERMAVRGKEGCNGSQVLEGFRAEALPIGCWNWAQVTQGCIPPAVRGQGSRLWIKRFRVSGFGFRVSGFGFR